MVRLTALEGGGAAASAGERGRREHGGAAAVGERCRRERVRMSGADGAGAGHLGVAEACADGPPSEICVPRREGMLFCVSLRSVGKMGRPSGSAVGGCFR